MIEPKVAKLLPVCVALLIEVNPPVGQYQVSIVVVVHVMSEWPQYDDLNMHQANWRYV